jgi:diaminopimelate decarboxylase
MKKISDSLSIQGDRLLVEACDVTQLAKTYGTPLFVISESHLRSNLRRYKTAFETCWPEGQVRIMPAIKASPIVAIRRVLSDEGCGCDVFGPGELECAIRGGVDPADISVNGSIKDSSIIRRAIDMGARIVLDSPRELELCEAEAAKLKKLARVMFRIKPFMEELETKSDFIPDADIRELTQMIKYGVPTSEVLPMVGGWVPSEVDFGGGFPSFPDKDTDVYIQGYEGPSVEEYARGITDSFRSAMREAAMDPTGITIEVEPGRGLHCDTGIHLTTVHNIKEETENRPRKWVELDTSEVFLGIPGFNEEPPFDVIFANKANHAMDAVTDMVGQTCNAELLFNQVSTPQLEQGDVVALLNTGSYIEPMAANFNALPRPGTVLVCGDQAELIKRHETVDEVFARDIIPERMKAQS